METNRRTAARAVAAVLTADGLLHVFWATGRTWPAGDPAALSHALLGADVPFTPPVVLPLAALLFTAAALVTARSRRGGRLLQAATVAVACGTALRGLVGLAWAFGIRTGLDDGADATFYWLNLVLYTPVCLALAAAALHVSRGPRERSE